MGAKIASANGANVHILDGHRSATPSGRMGTLECVRFENGTAARKKRVGWTTPEEVRYVDTAAGRFAGGWGDHMGSPSVPTATESSVGAGG